MNNTKRKSRFLPYILLALVAGLFVLLVFCVAKPQHAEAVVGDNTDSNDTARCTVKQYTSSGTLYNSFDGNTANLYSESAPMYFKRTDSFTAALETAGHNYTQIKLTVWERTPNGAWTVTKNDNTSVWHNNPDSTLNYWNLTLYCSDLVTTAVKDMCIRFDFYGGITQNGSSWGVKTRMDFYFSQDNAAGSATFKKTDTNKTTITNGYTNGNFTFNYTNAGSSPIVERRVTRPGGSYATFTTDPYTVTAATFGDGTYTFAVTDWSGNVYTSAMTVDRMLPTVNLAYENLSGSTYYIRSSQAITYSDDRSGVYNVSVRNTASGVVVSSSSAGYTFVMPGNYTVTVTDRAGNQYICSVVYDNTTPIITAKKQDGSSLNAALATGGTFRFSYSDAGGSAVKTAVLTRGGVTVSASYASDALVTTSDYPNGKYTLTVTDWSENVTALTVTRDTATPIPVFSNVEGTLPGQPDYYYVRYDKTASLSWAYNSATESAVSVTLNGNTYPAGTPITAAGTHQIVLSDAAGNSRTLYLVVDKASPAGDIVSSASTVLPAFTDKDFRLVYTDAGGSSIASVTLNYPGGETVAYAGALIVGDGYLDSIAGLWVWINPEGRYTFTIADYAGNVSARSICFDRTAPTGSFAGVTPVPGTDNAFYTASMTSLSWLPPTATEAPVSVTIDGQPYISGTAITLTGTYTVELSDSVGNATVYRLTIGTPPSAMVVNAAGNELGAYTAGKFRLAYNIFGTGSTDAVTLLRPGQSIAGPYDGALLSPGETNPDGLYVFTVTDISAPPITLSIILDTTAPVGAFSPERPLPGTAGAFYMRTNETAYFVWEAALPTQSPVSATLNNAPYVQGTPIAVGFGQHTLVLSDAAGNTTAYTLVLDGTAPTVYAVTATGGVVGRYTAGAFSFFYSDLGGTGLDLSSMTLTRPHATGLGTVTESYGGGTVSPGADGVYTLSVADLAGNVATASVVIDTIAPVGYFEHAAPTGRANEFYLPVTHNQTAFFWDDPDPMTAAPVYATLYGEVYTKGTPIPDTAQGHFELILYDEVKNAVTYYLVIDRTPPHAEIVTVLGSPLGLYTQGNFRLEATDADTGIAYMRLVRPNGIEESYTGKTTVTGIDGVYTYTAVDLAGNSASISIIVDTLAPVGVFTNAYLLPGKTDTFYVRVGDGDASFAWETPTAVQSPLDYVLLNGYVYEPDALITGDGTHELIMRDVAGNSSTYYLIIDNIVPTAEILSGFGILLGQYTHNNFYLRYDDKGGSGIASATLTRPGRPAEDYTGATVIPSTDGLYLFTVTDLAGNGVSVSIVVDTAAPTGSFESAVPVPGMVRTFYATSVSAFVFSSAGAQESPVSASLNGVYYTSGSEIDVQGSYELILSDIAENATTYTLIIGAALPSAMIVNAQWQAVSGGYTSKSFALSYNLSGESLIQSVTVTRPGGGTSAYGGETLSPGTSNPDGLYTFTVTDLIGGSTNAQIVLDTVAPAGSFANALPLPGRSDTFYVRVSNTARFLWVTASASQAPVSARLGASTYTSGTPITGTGTHELTLLDEAGNASVYYLVVDRTAPTAQITSIFGVELGAYTRGSFTLSPSDSGGTGVDTVTLTRPSGSTESYAGSTVNPSMDGLYLFTITDLAGNVATASVIVDATAPTGVFTNAYPLPGSPDTFYSRMIAAASLSWSVPTGSESPVSVHLNGATYAQGTPIETGGTHTLLLLDGAGNGMTYTLIVDKSAPTAIVTDAYGEAIYEYTNGRFTLNYADTGGSGIASVTLTRPNGSAESYAGGTITPSVDGLYLFTVSDLAGNAATASVIVDTTAPGGAFTNALPLPGSAATFYVRVNVTPAFTWDLPSATESPVSATLNGQPYTRNAVITASGAHELVLADFVGNASTYYIVIDRTAPTAEVQTPLGSAIGAYTRSAFVLDYGDTGGSGIDGIMLTRPNGSTESYTGGTVNPALDGLYRFEVSDRAGNTVTTSIIVDTTAPEGHFENVVPVPGTFNAFYTTTANAFFVFSPAGAQESPVSATRNGTDYISGYAVATLGRHEFVLSDTTGNSNSYFLTIGSLPSAMTVNSQGNALGAYTRDAFALAYNLDGGSMVASVTLVKPSGPVVYNGETLSPGASNPDGLYVFTVADLLGDTVTVQIVLDTVAPVGTFTDAMPLPGGNSAYYVRIADTARFSWVAASASQAPVSARLGASAYTSGTPITGTGTHELTLLDEAGNASVYYLVVDRTAPTAQITSIFGVELGMYTKGNFVLSSSDSGGTGVDTATLTRPSGSTESYAGGTITPSVDGLYLFTVTDLAGNVATVSVIVDTTAPVGAFTDALPLPGKADTFYVRFDMTTAFTWDLPSVSESPVSATLNGQPYSRGATIATTGTHELTLTDFVRNASTYYIVIDRTAPTAEVQTPLGSAIGAYTRSAFVLDYGDTGGSGIDGITLTRPNGNAESYAGDKVNPTFDGLYIFNVTDRAGNAATTSVIVDTTAPVGSFEGVVPVPGTVNTFYAASVSSFAFSLAAAHESPVTAMLNAYPYQSGTFITDDGRYELVLSDAAGNGTAYILIIGVALPSAMLVNGSDMPVSGYTGRAFALRYNLSGNELLASVTLTRPGGTSAAYGGETLSPGAGNPDGLYTFTVADLAGRTVTYSIILDTVAPAGTFSGALPLFGRSDTYYDRIDGSATFSWIEATENQAPVSAFVDGVTYVRGTGLAPVPGTHELTLLDEAGNASVYYLVVDRTAPTAQITSIFGVELGAYTRGSFTLSPSDSGGTGVDTVTLTRPNGSTESYAGGTVNPSMDGLYLFTVTDLAGNVATASVIVDTTAPVGTFTDALPLPGKADTFYVHFDVTPAFTWDLPTATESPVSATINGQPYARNAVITASGAHELVLADAVGNTYSYYIVIDRTAPILSATDSGGADIGAAVNKAFRVSASDLGVGLDTLMLLCPGEVVPEAYINGTLIRPADGDGLYVFIATDLCGNAKTLSVRMDTAVPLVFLLSEGGSSVSSHHNGRFYALAEDDTLVTARVTLPTGQSRAYAVGSLFAPTLDGMYGIVVTDAAGNTANVELVIDTVLPMLSLSANGLTNEAIAVTAFDANLSGIRYALGGSGYTFAPGNSFTVAASSVNNGIWTFSAVDLAGNESATFSVTLDTIAPAHNALPQYARDVVLFAPTDTSGIAEVYARHGDGAYIHIYDYTYSVTLSDDTAGEWWFYAVDNAGNASEPQRVILQFFPGFGNVERIESGYRVLVWYEVALPASVFGAAAGTFSFTTNAAALAYAVVRERQQRVSVVTGGWVYVSAQNEHLTQLYTDEAMLDAVIEMYAKRYLTGEVRYTGDDAAYHTPAGDGLTLQTLQHPAFLSVFASYTLLLCRPDFFFVPAAQYAVPSSVTIRLIADDVHVLPESAAVAVPYGMSLSQALAAADALRQGYYLVTERDEAGYTESYIIYLDLSAPLLLAEVSTGNGSTSLTFYEQFVTEFAGTLYYTGVTFTAVADNADEYVCLSVVGNGINAVFVPGDTLPTLSAPTFSGRYAVSLYDRSGNRFTFDIILAGSTPHIEASGLSGDIATLTLVVGDELNAVTGLQLFKVRFDGTYEELLFDDSGIPVNFLTLSYTLTIGGKYVFRYTDLYGRTGETAPVFFTKGMPTATLSGVTDGGVTNLDVRLTYSGEDILELYAVILGNRILFTDYTLTALPGNLFTLTVTADENTSFAFVALLYKPYERNLFTEYTFEIDTILPELRITDIQNRVLQPNGTTNAAFMLSWDEPLSLVYSLSDNSWNMQTYTKESALTADGLYSFTMTDTVGNVLVFTVLLDTYVAYALDGEHIVTAPGHVLTKNALTFIFLEEVTAFFVLRPDGTSAAVLVLDTDGVYTVSGEDLYGNVLELVITLDTVPPDIALIGVENGGATKEPVTVNVSDFSAIYLVTESGDSLLDTGATFSEHGTVRIRAVDAAGNTAEVNFSVDTRVEYLADTPDNAYTTNPVSFVFSEPLGASAISRDNEPIEGSPTVFSLPGRYNITATDMVGNTLTYTFTILPVRAREITLPVIGTGWVPVAATLFGLPMQLTVTKNGVVLNVSGLWHVEFEGTDGAAFMLDIEIDNVPPVVEITQEKMNVAVIGEADKPNVTYTLTRDGAVVAFVPEVTEAGAYVLTVADDLGNESVYSFIIEYKANGATLILIAVGSVGLILVLFLIVRTRRKPRVK